jgi:carbonic anhydrase
MPLTKLRVWTCAVLFCLPMVVRADEPPVGLEALQKLKAGNARFASDKPTTRDVGKARRAELAKGQKPFAIVLACADSRVTPELIFDQGLGDLFVLRLAGNVVEPAVLGSIEFAIENLHTPLIVVLGHESCGAVMAAVDGEKINGNLGWLVERVHAGKDLPKDPKTALAAGIKNNALYQAEQLSTQSKVIKEFLQAKRVQLVAGVYSLSTGKVDWLDLPKSKEEGGEKKNGSKEARIKVMLPSPDAKLWFNDAPIARTGAERAFASPALEEGKTYRYKVKATWKENGADVTREKKVVFRAGDEVVVDFRN